MEAWVLKVKGCLSYPSIDDGREDSSFSFFLLPIKLSSTRRPGPEPRRVNTLELPEDLVFVLGARDTSQSRVMSTELTVKGQPREYWILIEA